MANELFDDMKAYIGFGEADARLLAELAQPLCPVLPAVIDEFYRVIFQNPNASAIIGDDPSTPQHLRELLLNWLRELFSGRYDDAYFDSRARIGRTHVRIELPQHYMFTGMTVIRLGLMAAMQKLGPRFNSPAHVSAVHKILDLELAIMNQSYRENLVHRIQEMQRAEFEARISESEHLATIGQLAASLAHEIKNPLAGISGAIQVLGSGLQQGHPHKEIISETLKQIDRLDSAVKDLLIFARPKAPEKAPHDLGDIISRSLMILREEPAFRKLRVHSDGMGRGHILTVDAAQIQQVITNLLLNAAHACERGGEIYCRVGRYEAGMRIVVEDTGVGIPPAILAKVFEPFYTTKARGTGLGLSICKRIVESHSGVLEIDSRPGKGTRVTVKLPEMA